MTTGCITKEHIGAIIAELRVACFVRGLAVANGNDTKGHDDEINEIDDRLTQLIEDYAQREAEAGVL